MNKSSMVLALVNKFTKGNKAQFANMLGVSSQTVSAWVARNTFDAELIYAKCSGVSADWLLTGEGEMIKEQDRQLAELRVQEKFPLKTDNLCLFSAFLSIIWRRRPGWSPCSMMSMQEFRSAIFLFQTYLLVMGPSMYGGIRCILYSKAVILFSINRCTICNTVSFGVKCT